MTRKEAERQTRQADTLRALGFTAEEAESLRRISMTLHRWYERGCGSDSACLVRGRLNGVEFEYDDEGDPYEEYAGASGRHRYHRVPDRERGAVARLKAIIAARNDRGFVPEGARVDADGRFTLSYYLQTDPRGAALYIIRPGDVPEGQSVESYYTRGICIY